MSNEELIELWDEHRPFIYKIALQYSGYAEMDDLMQEGYLELYSYYHVLMVNTLT